MRLGAGEIEYLESIGQKIELRCQLLRQTLKFLGKLEYAYGLGRSGTGCHGGSEERPRTNKPRTPPQSLPPRDKPLTSPS